MISYTPSLVKSTELQPFQDLPWNIANYLALCQVYGFDL